MMKFIAVTCGKPSLSIVASAALRCSRKNTACSSAVRRMSGRSGIGFTFLKPRQHCAHLAEGATAAELADQREQRLTARPETGREERLELPPHVVPGRSEEHTSELQSLAYLVCRLLLEKKKPARRAVALK